MPAWMMKVGDATKELTQNVPDAHKQLTECAARLYEALQEAQPVQNPMHDEQHDPFAEDGEDPVPHLVREAMEDFETNLESLDESAKAMEAQDHDSRCASWKAWVEAALAGGLRRSLESPA